MGAGFLRHGRLTLPRFTQEPGALYDHLRVRAISTLTAISVEPAGECSAAASIEPRWLAALASVRCCDGVQDPNYLATILTDSPRTVILDIRSAHHVIEDTGQPHLTFASSSIHRVPSIPVAELGAHTVRSQLLGASKSQSLKLS